MKDLKLIVARHGDYNRRGDKRLNQDGIVSIKQLASQIKSIAHGKNTAILSSTITRAFESATIIGKELDINDIEGCDILWSDDNHIDNLPAIFSLIESHSKNSKNDVVILVTHGEYTECLPSYFGEKYLNLKSQNRLRSFTLDYSEAWVIDCTTQTLQLIR